MTAAAAPVSSAFLWRRAHSLMGLWLILYLIEHLIVNSQAALWIGDDGSGFVRLVNSLEQLPYLQVIEFVFIAIPLIIHGVWGVIRALSAKTNSLPSDGSSPSFSYARNRAFTWQRLTSWILLFGIAGHIVQMRFINYPRETMVGNEKQYLTKVSVDDGIDSVAGRIGVKLYGPEEIAAFRGGEKWMGEVSSFHPHANEVVVMAPSPGKAMLFMVRDTFKSSLMSVLYTIFVLAAAFHAFNGFWTSLITWGAILSYRSQKAMLPVGWAGMALLAFLGIAAIWGSYWINLRN